MPYPTIGYPLGLTRGPIRNSRPRPSWDRSTSATRRASAGKGPCMAHQRSDRLAVQSDVSIHAKFTARLNIEI